MNKRVTVYGAYGHTGRFVVAELRKRGWTPVLSGRNHSKLLAEAASNAGAEVRVATVDDPVALNRAISGSSAVINCAGPFIDTAIPIIKVAVRADVHYLDVAAEQPAVLGVFDHFRTDPGAKSIVIAPAMAFYGGLGDLMATAAMGEWDRADEICIAVALDSWRPTRGTRVTGERNPGRRFILSNNKLERADPPPARMWNFPAPFGEQHVVPLSLAETITISRHLRTPEIRVFMNSAPLEDLHNPDTPPPVPADDSGRSSQVFVIDVVARRGGTERRVVARGRDIYAVTAPIVVEATQRVVAGAIKRMGALAAGELFDARDFLQSLGRAHVTVDFSSG
jgi:Saccharopine dehydrogenase NADP binding domain